MMQLKINRASFLKALTTVGRAIPSRTTKEILKNVLLRSTTNKITLIATDSEIGMRVEVSDVIKADGGECLLPGRFLAVLMELPDKELTIEIESGTVQIKGQAADFKLLTEDPADFPSVPTFDDESYFRIKAGELRRLIKRTLFASDSESTRYALGGVQVDFHSTPGRVIFAATDSRRLAVDHAAIDRAGTPVAGKPEVIPSKAMKLLQSIADDEAEVQISIDRTLAVKSGLVTLTSPFVQGRFPDWRKVMPTSSVSTIDLVVSPFLGAVRQAMTIRSEESKTIEFSLSAKRLRMAGKSDEIGDTKVDFPIAYTGPDLKINFDPSYIADFLKALEGTMSIQFKVISAEDPGLFEAGDYKYICMPCSREK